LAELYDFSPNDSKKLPREFLIKDFTNYPKKGFQNPNENFMLPKFKFRSSKKPTFNSFSQPLLISSSLKINIEL
jgi:hypothetical protein